MQRITLSIDDDLAAALDRHMKKRRYASRSEALRDILRERAAREQLDEGLADKADGFCIATLAYVYDHETRDLGRRLNQAQHKHHDLQVATLHVHLDHDSCLEVAVLRLPPVDASSTGLRERLAAGLPLSPGAVPDLVVRYVQKYGLYR